MRYEFITEDDNIYEIVTKFPELKKKLPEISPRFERMQNPVVFNTVARVTSVKKAAEVGKVYLREMLYQLNEAIGKSAEYLAYAKKQNAENQDAFMQQAFAGKTKNPEAEPEWYPLAAAFQELDVRGMAVDPFERIMELVKTIGEKGGFTLVQKFEPAPLIMYLKTQNFEHYTQKVSDSEYRIAFYRKGA